jgi:hypothetical protein
LSKEVEETKRGLKASGEKKKRYEAGDVGP